MKRIMLLLVFAIIAACSIEKQQEPIKGLDGKDGEPGLNSLIIQEEVEEGLLVMSGQDTNANGELDLDEILYTNLIKHGIDGEQGEQGPPGENGVCPGCKYTCVVEEVQKEPYLDCIYAYKITTTYTDYPDLVIVEYVCRDDFAVLNED